MPPSRRRQSSGTTHPSYKPTTLALVPSPMSRAPAQEVCHLSPNSNARSFPVVSLPDYCSFHSPTLPHSTWRHIIVRSRPDCMRRNQ
jgi:hypothetical protein